MVPSPLANRAPGGGADAGPIVPAYETPFQLLHSSPTAMWGRAARITSRAYQVPTRSPPACEEQETLIIVSVASAPEANAAPWGLQAKSR